MARGARYLAFDGQFESNVLGTFRLIRGFANLKDLATISVPYLMEDSEDCAQVSGQQRQIDPKHAERIKKYLESGEQRFLPEVILSVRADLTETLDLEHKPVGVETKSNEDGIEIRRKWKSRNIRVHSMIVDKYKLENILTKKLIRRVDGNHRLALADQLADDESIPTKYLASFCIVLLGPPDEAADDYSESLIFHTINSTALPLESEHALKLILGQHADYDMSPESEFAFSPDLHFTRLLRDGFLKLPEPARSRLGNRPLTSLRGAVRGLMEMDAAVADTLPTLCTYSEKLLAALNDIVTRMEPSQPELCKAEFFIELSARLWKATPENDTHAERVNAVVAYLEQLAGWLGRDGLISLKESQSLCSQIIEIYQAICVKIPKRVFLARWYPKISDGEQKTRADNRLSVLKNLVENDFGLELVDLGTEEGGTQLIHPRMYEAIGSSDIFIADLTGLRPNVMIELGFALHHQPSQRLLLVFNPIIGADKVPFDTSGFRYEEIGEAQDIIIKLKGHIERILQYASYGQI
jgi:hypothetical protein